jgi:heme oxygenase
MHQRQKKFRIEDHIYYIKLRVKPGNEAPLLIDILFVLQEGFNYILNNLRQFYDSSHHNIAYMTFYQEPMINGLNTGAFDIQDNGSQMIERLLKMLNQFLISNQSLQVNNTFKVYIKVLSIDHMNYKKNMPAKKKPKRKFQAKHYGKKTSNKNYNFFWAINVPNGTKKHFNVFKDKCLLTCTVLGIAQNEYYKSNRKIKDFIYMQSINSTQVHKQNHACKLILNNLSKLICDLNLPEHGPYNVEQTIPILSNFLNCQFFIFDSIDNSTKLKYMYPNEYNDTLQPIYLFEPLDDPEHLLFIRHLNSYFKNNVKVCFSCKKIFKSFKYKHLCNQRKVCFSCRRPFANQKTYLHEKLNSYFCDKETTSEKSKICPICNVTMYSKHCEKSHRANICNGSGGFGWKCLNCNKFTYRSGASNSKLIANLHKCGVKSCKFCHLEIDSTNHHICKLRKELYPKEIPSLAFIGMEHSFSGVGKCFDCFSLKLNFKEENALSWKELYESSIFSSLNCPLHVHNYNSEPNIAIIYKETNVPGNFDKYVLTDNNSEIEDSVENVAAKVNFLKNFSFLADKKTYTKEEKLSEAFKTNREKLQNIPRINLSLIDKIVQLVLQPEWRNTTFISQDSDSLNYVRISIFY